MYSGVLNRHESLAASLGAKLVGPLLLKTLDKLFDGPIRVVQSSFAVEQTPVTWLDIVTYSRTNLTDFVLVEIPYGKVCRIWIKGGQVEISEDDYRLILSGAPERVIPTQPVAEDESAEMGTLNILESRLAMLIKRADAVASKARQLNYHLKGRKSAILSRKTEKSSAIPEVAVEPRPFSPQSFLAVNARSPLPISNDSKLQQELLEQFKATERTDRVDRRGSLTHTPRPKAGRANISSFSVEMESGDGRRLSHPITSSDDGIEGHYRVLMAAKIEKLARGEVINPPCDRCRRLKFECTKHLTACSACTKKHAKCSWRDLKEGELEITVPSSTEPAASGDNDYKMDEAKSASQTREHTAEQPDQVIDGSAFVYPPPSAEELKTLTQIATAASLVGK
jgi:hypothetical protein